MTTTIQQRSAAVPPRAVVRHIDREEDVSTAEYPTPESAAETRIVTEETLAPQEEPIIDDNSDISTGWLNNSLNSGPLTADSTPTMPRTLQVTDDTHPSSSSEPPEYVQEDVAAAPPADHLAPGQIACHTSGGRIITRIIANRIDAHPLWDMERDGRPSGQALQSFTVILSISPSCTFADFKALLVPKLEEQVLQKRKSGPREGEIIKAWPYVKWREPAKGFLGMRKWKSRTLGVDEMNWTTIMVALRDRTLVGELKVTFWNEVPLSDAERARQLAIAHMYRTTLRPFGAW